MAAIVENILGDKALQLAHDEFVRKLSFGNQWTLLRIGMRMRIFGNWGVGGQLSQAMFHVGLNNGDQYTFNSPACAGYVGIVPGTTSGGGNFYYNYNSANKWYTTPGTYFYHNVKKLGSTITFEHFGSTGLAYFAAAAAAPRIFVVGFYRTAATTVTPYFYYSTIAQFAYKEPTTYDLMRCVEGEDIGGYPGNFITGPASSAAMTSVASNLDTLSIYWNRNIPALEIYDVVVVRYY